jgi:hypothetical protein
MTSIPLLHGDKMLAMAKPGRWFKATAPVECGVFRSQSPATFPAGTLFRVRSALSDGCVTANAGDGEAVIFGLSAAVRLIPVVLDGDEVIEQPASV